jgi:predicted RNA-binding protein Jag
LQLTIKTNKMEFKGTIGKWKSSELKTFGRQMVDLGDFNGCVDVWYHNGESMTKEEAEANAKLIAAAPKLLKALQELLYDMDMRDDWSYDVSEAEEAIYKALDNEKL